MAYQNKDALSLTPASATEITVDRFVGIGTSGVAQTANNGDAVGVAQDPSANGEVQPIQVAPLDGKSIVEVESGEAIAIGDDVASDAQGRAKTAVSTSVVLGKAITAVSAAGLIVEVVASKGGRQA